MAPFIIFILIGFGFGVYGFIQDRKIITSPMIDVDFKKVVTNTLLLNIPFTISFTLLLIGGMAWGNYNADGLHWFKLIAGGIIFSFSLITAIHFFIYYYYGKNIDKKMNKFLFASFICLFVVSLLTLFLWLDGYAPYLKYPLVNGINFNKGFVAPEIGGSNPNLAWYALCILSGAILVYFISDHLMYKEYGKHGICESTFYVAFPAGVVGARLWYCIGEGLPLSQWIRIWEGGLTVVGGALTGIVVGVIWFMKRNPKYSIFVAVDCIVPTILIAQTIGRWGNFFNCEVHGLEVSLEYFKWMPEILQRNAAYSCQYGFASEGNIFLPLFLIEGIMNMFGYFAIAHLFGKRLFKVLEPGDLGIAYIIWYGMTRVILEPFRDSHFNMGGKGYWSWIWCLLYVLIGSIAIIANHVIRYILKKRKGTYIVQKGDVPLGLIETGVFGGVGIALLVIGAMKVAAAPSVETHSIGFSDPFNIGVMLLVLGGAILVYAVPALIRFFEAKRKVVHE